MEAMTRELKERIACQATYQVDIAGRQFQVDLLIDASLVVCVIVLSDLGRGGHDGCECCPAVADEGSRTQAVAGDLLERESACVQSLLTGGVFYSVLSPVLIVDVHTRENRHLLPVCLCDVLACAARFAHDVRGEIRGQRESMWGDEERIEKER